MLKLFNKKAQSTAEYAIVIGLVIAALTAMQIYVKRGIQGRVKDVSDFYLGEAAGDPILTESNLQDAGGTVYQFEPGQIESAYNTTRDQADTLDISRTVQGTWNKTIQKDKVTRTDGYQKYKYNP